MIDPQGRHHGAAREPALMMVRHIASHTSMKERARSIRAHPATAAPLAAGWRNHSRCRRPAAGSARPSRRPERFRPWNLNRAITKQLNSVTLGRPRACQDSSGGKEFGPPRRKAWAKSKACATHWPALRLRQRQRHARPAVGHIAVDGRATGASAGISCPRSGGKCPHGAITIISVRGSPPWPDTLVIWAWTGLFHPPGL